MYLACLFFNYLKNNIFMAERGVVTHRKEAVALE
jgi:hypothetical protein